jgi:hypothetical protein
MSNSKQFALPILILILLVGLMVSFRSFLLTYIVEPVALLFWALWRVIASVDQHIYWFALIVFCSILVLRLLPTENDSSSGSAYNDREKSLNRVEHWQTLIKDAVWGNEESRLLSDNLKDLLISIGAQDEQSEPIELEEIFMKGEKSLPLAVQQYLFSPVDRGGKFFIIQKINLMFLTPRWIRKWISKFIYQDYTLIDETLRWMEIELEINDEE